MECVATHNYKGQYEDELSLKTGDKVEVTADSKYLLLLVCTLNDSELIMDT